MWKEFHKVFTKFPRSTCRTRAGSPAESHRPRKHLVTHFLSYLSYHELSRRRKALTTLILCHIPGSQETRSNTTSQMQPQLLSLCSLQLTNFCSKLYGLQIRQVWSGLSWNCLGSTEARGLGPLLRERKKGSNWLLQERCPHSCRFYLLSGLGTETVFVQGNVPAPPFCGGILWASWRQGGK